MATATCKKKHRGGVGLILPLSGDATVQKVALLQRSKQIAHLESWRYVEAADPYTQGHEVRVARLAKLIAHEMHLPEDEAEGIEMAGLVHDIGKLCVPPEILMKSGRLSDVEVDLIKLHTKVGYAILKDIDFTWAVADIVLAHHERMDGSGYPGALTGNGIIRGARVLAVADVVEAMASDRPYRPALGLDAAVTELTQHRERYDPDVVAAFIALYESGRIGLQDSSGSGEPATPARALATSR